MSRQNSLTPPETYASGECDPAGHCRNEVKTTMKKATTVQYNTADLERQSPEIEDSRIRAIQKIVDIVIGKITGLSLSDPPELWIYAFSRIEPSAWDRSQEPNLWLKAAYLLENYPRFFQGAKTHEQLVAAIRKTTLKGITNSLSLTAQSDDELANWLSKLLALHKRSPISRSEIEGAFAGARRNRTESILLRYWIEYPRTANWVINSLCFYSDRAMAKLVYFSAHDWQKWLPTELLTKEPERIYKLYPKKLGLLAADPRVIKDVDYVSGKLEWIPFEKRLAKEDQQKRKAE